jgi:twitching motility two-component system response regulator PilH
MPKKILIVDDSFAEIQLMEVMLKKAGYWPIAINDPKKVEQMITMERPNLILLDVVMPEKNGFQVCRELKNNANFSAIPVIMVTSKNTDSDRFWAQKQGADGFVTKPFTAEQLLGAVAKFVAPGN